MRRVAQFLKDRAQQASDAEDENDFGRSAINRYYYASFLAARELIRHTLPDKISVPHAGLPDMLTGTLRNKIRRNVQSAEKSGLLRNNQAQPLLHEATKAISELVDLLKVANQYRVLADYHPDERIERQNGVLQLKSMTLDAASNWPHRADRSVGSILRIWKQIGN